MNYTDFVKSDGGIFAPAEFSSAGVSCGLIDIGVLYSKTPCDVCGVFSENKFLSESQKLSNEVIENNKINAIFFNNGNANSCVKSGYNDAKTLTEAVAKELKLNSKNVAISSSGFVCIPLKAERICGEIPALIKGLNTTDPTLFNRSLCDEKDSVIAESACSYKLGSIVCKTGALIKKTAKQNSSFNTYTCIITTDACVDKLLMQKALNKVYPLTIGKLNLESSSVSDIVLLISSGFAGNKLVEYENIDYNTFLNSLYYVLSDCIKQTKALEGEKVVEWICVNAQDELTAENTVNHLSTCNISEVFASGIFSDLINGIGTVDTIPDIEKIDISLKTAKAFEKILEKGQYADFDTYKITDMLCGKEVKIIIDLNCGECNAVSWSSY